MFNKLDTVVSVVSWAKGHREELQMKEADAIIPKI